MKKPLTKVVRALAAIAVIFAFSIGTPGSPASAAAALGVSFTIVAGAESGSAVVTASSIHDQPIDFDVKVDGVKIATFATAPGGTLEVRVENSASYANLTPGSVLTVVYAPTNLVVGTYEVPGVPSRLVTPLAPTSDGLTVVIPSVPDGSYVYKDPTTGAVLPAGPRPLAPGSPFMVVAAPALPGVTLTTTGPWVFPYIPPVTPEPEKASSPHAPTFVDKCGTANDTIIYPELVKGIEKYVTGDQPGGLTVVRAALKEGFAPPEGQLSWTFTFTNESCEPKPEPKPNPNPVEANPVVPHTNQQVVKTPIVTQPKVTQSAQTAVTSGDRNYTVRGAASGASTASVSAWPPIAAGVLALVAVVAVTRRRSVTGASE